MLGSLAEGVTEVSGFLEGEDSLASLREILRLRYLVGLDNGGTANKFTVMDREGNFLIDRLVEDGIVARAKAPGQT